MCLKPLCLGDPWCLSWDAVRVVMILSIHPSNERYSLHMLGQGGIVDGWPKAWDLVA